MARNRRTRIAALVGATAVAAVLTLAQPASAKPSITWDNGTTTDSITWAQSITWGSSTQSITWVK
jgi:hypothetical protein